MQISHRLVRSVLVLLALPAIVLLVSFVGYAAVIVVAVANSGGSGMPKASSGLAPLIAFTAGAIAAGWLATLLMALSPMRNLLVLPALGSSLVGGLTAILVPSLAKGLLAVVPSALSLIAIIFAPK